MNIYLSHAYISKTHLKASKSYIQERKRNKRESTQEVVMILHEIRSSNSLKTIPSGVAKLSQPTLRREGDPGLTGVSSKGGKYTESPPMFIRGKRQKNWKDVVYELWVWKGSGVVFTHGEGISTPCVRHKGWQPLIKCSISCLWFVLVSLFLRFYVFCIFIFLWSTRVLPSLLRILNCDEEIRPT